MKVAFASCSSIAGQHDNQPIWGVIHAQKPDLLLLLGDNVYIGKDGYVTETLAEKAGILEEKYKRQLAEPHFNKLLSKVPYLAVWDNHDFGLPGHNFHLSDPSISVPQYGYDVPADQRNMARGLFNQYLKYGSQRPWSNHVYCSYTKDNVKFIMLDVRSRQQDPNHGNPAAQLLDPEQAEWLRDELSSHPAQIKVICSGLPYSLGGVCWTKHINWCAEFLNMIPDDSKLLFLGGNIHSNKFIDTTDKPFYEIISSGVGQHFKGEQTDEEEEVNEDDVENADTLTQHYGNIFDGRPKNHFGMIDFTESKVRVSLYSQMPENNYYAVINRDTWKLERNWRMGYYSNNYV